MPADGADGAVIGVGPRPDVREKSIAPAKLQLRIHKVIFKVPRMAWIQRRSNPIPILQRISILTDD